MATITDATTISDIQAAYNAGNWTRAYQLVFDALTTNIPADGQPGSVSVQSPVGDLDRAVWLWIAGARNMNSSTGAFASYR